jgi:hypothetical protein
MSDAPCRPVQTGCLWSILLAFVAFVAGCCGGCLLGGIWGQHALQHRQYIEERDDVAPILAKDPAFKGVRIDEFSGGGIALEGHVPTEADKTRLRSAVSKALGDRRTKQVFQVYVGTLP